MYLYAQAVSAPDAQIGQSRTMQPIVQTALALPHMLVPVRFFCQIPQFDELHVYESANTYRLSW